MGQLNFCKSCGNKRVKEVKAELEALLQKKDLDGRTCAVCCKMILKEELMGEGEAGLLKEELIDESHAGLCHDDENVDQRRVKSSTAASHSDYSNVTEVGEIDDGGARETETNSGADSDQSVDLEKLKEEACGDSDVSDAGSNYADEIEIDLKKDFSTENEGKMDGASVPVKRRPYVRRKPRPIDLSHLHPKVQDMIDAESVKPNVISCKTCSKEFKRLAGIRSFVLHISSHSGDEPISKPYKCPDCEQTFKYSSYLLAHLRSHSDIKILECDFPDCEFRFNSKQGLRRHIDGFHHGIKAKPKRKQQHICQICGRVLESGASLKKHLLRHNQREKLFKCDVCGKCFHDKVNMKRHKIRHTEEKNTTCEICGKGFHIVQELNTHLVTHNDDRKYQCEFCPHKAKRLGNLKAHIRNIHSEPDRDRYTCAYCGLKFVSQGARTKHEKKHQECGLDLPEVLLKPYQCQECGYRATKPYRIRMHMRAHTGEKPFQCMHCKKMFAQRSQCTKHLKICKKRY